MEVCERSRIALTLKRWPGYLVDRSYARSTEGEQGQMPVKDIILGFVLTTVVIGIFLISLAVR